jgi:tetratricopeptide (TPR) repeat protein
MTCKTFGWAATAMSVLITSASGGDTTARVWQEPLVIPTYRLGDPDKNPIFYAGRKYQGAQGPVYPYPMLDRLSHNREDKTYQAIYLESQYVQLSILPELGGRIFSGQDKTNRYDFFYRQHVIKPALIGMAGAWISGGVEWNIPHHHRATTFMPVDCRMVDNPDGSKTVWVGETELRHRMKWLVGITLRPDRSYVEITTKLFNRTGLPWSMLCFANAAVHCGPDYQVIFPPNTEFGAHHAKREFVHWPIGQSVYNKLDRSGVDVSWWKNHPSPISIFAWNYEDDFVGGYDHGKQAGVVHVADHHVAPGKKFFTWGADEEAQMWDKVLTDTDGPYIELMAGDYSDNQPGYSWVHPYETRTVTEYWYPVRSLGGIKNANRDAAVNLEVDTQHTARIAVNTTTEVRDARVVLKQGDTILLDQKTSIGPALPLVAEIALKPDVKPEDLRLAVLDGARELISYQPAKPRGASMPPAVTPPARPKDVKTIDQLYLIGLRLEQFHNPALAPDPYYEEILRRDPDESRANTALGILYCKRGRFAEAEQRLRTAVARITHRYTTPKNAEAIYYLGVALRGQGRYDAADEEFQRAGWDYAFASPSYYALAENACRKGAFAAALDFLARSLRTNTTNTKAMTLKAYVLRKLGRLKEAILAARETQSLDPLDFWSAREALLVVQATDRTTAEQQQKALDSLMRGVAEAYLELAADYAACGAWQEVTDVLTRFADNSPDKSRVNPMVYYDLAHACQQLGDSRRWHSWAWERFQHQSSTSVCIHRFRWYTATLVQMLRTCCWPVPQTSFTSWKSCSMVARSAKASMISTAVAWGSVEKKGNQSLSSSTMTTRITPPVGGYVARNVL